MDLEIGDCLITIELELPARSVDKRFLSLDLQNNSFYGHRKTGRETGETCPNAS